MSLKIYLQESLRELNNVTWPTRKQAIRITTIVFIFMILSGFALGVIDKIFDLGFQSLLSLSL